MVVSSAAPSDGKTTIVLGMDHGLRIEGTKTQEVYFPRRIIAGANRFVIPLSATLASPASYSASP